MHRSISRAAVAVVISCSAYLLHASYAADGRGSGESQTMEPEGLSDGGEPDPVCTSDVVSIDDVSTAGMAEPDCVADVGDCCSATVPACNLAYRQVYCSGTGPCSGRTIGPIYAHSACARWQRPTVCGSRGTPIAVRCRRTTDLFHPCVVDLTTCQDATPRACVLPAATTRDCYDQPGDPTLYCEDRVRYSDERCVPVDIDYCYATQAGVVQSITCRDR